ncbi:hypothetical protein MKX01_021282 [Papaver californicum]|nr:hypothetical protein MKX01_021282 [Papaver californicum]
MIDIGLTFFNESSITEKSKYSCDPNSAASEGYGSRMLVKEDCVLDWRDYFDHHTFPLSRRNPNRWPDFPTNYRGLSEHNYQLLPSLSAARTYSGLQSHSDIGAITLLIQDDIMTNGKYRSAVHRAVTNSHRVRLSVGTFHDPSKIRKIAPAAQLVDKATPARYKEVVYGEYVSNWYSKGPEGKRNIDSLLLNQQ